MAAFEQSQNCPYLYFTACDTAPSIQTGFLLPADTESPPRTISFEDSWNHFSDGVYLFLLQDLEEKNQASFASSAWYYRDNATRRGIRVAWFYEPNAHLLEGFFIAVHQQDDAVLTDRVTLIPNDDGTEILIGKDCPISLDHESVLISPAEDGLFAILAPDGTRIPIRGNIPIDLCGAQAGLVRDRFPISNPAAFDIGLRYFYPTHNSKSGISSHYYPVFVNIEEVERINDPFDHPETRKTALKFTRIDGEYPPIETYFRTIHGHTVYLRPTDNCYLLQVPKPVSTRPVSDPQTYRIPHGDFQITVEHTDRQGNTVYSVEEDDRLLCGISGVEYIGLSAYDGSGINENYLKFRRGNPAFAAAPQPGQTAGLSSIAQTAWCTVQCKDAALYYAQPEQAFIYQDAGTPQMLDYLEIPATELPPNSQNDNDTFPMVPYGGLKRRQLDSCY